MTAEMTLGNNNRINERNHAEKKFSFKKSFIQAGVLYAASQAAYFGNGRLAAELMKDYEDIA